MNPPRPMLVAGIGNIFFGDDGFGCEVVRELLRQRRPWPAERPRRGFRHPQL